MTSYRTRCKSGYQEASNLGAFERHVVENVSTRRLPSAASARPEKGRGWDGTYCGGPNTVEVPGAAPAQLRTRASLILDAEYG